MVTRELCINALIVAVSVTCGTFTLALTAKLTRRTGIATLSAVFVVGLQVNTRFGCGPTYRFCLQAVQFALALQALGSRCTDFSARPTMLRAGL